MRWILKTWMVVEIEDVVVHTPRYIIARSRHSTSTNQDGPPRLRRYRATEPVESLEVTCPWFRPEGFELY